MTNPNEHIEEGVPKTLFNASLAKLERIGSLKKAIHETAVEGDLKKWFLLTIRFTNELWEKLSNDERTELNIRGGYITNLRKGLAEAERINHGNIDVQARIEFWMDLNDYERKLSVLESKYGMSMIDQDDDSLGDGEF